MKKHFITFNVPDEHDTEISNSNIEKVVGHYISQQYHDQFNYIKKVYLYFYRNSSTKSCYYDFYDYDPYQLAANNAKALKDHIEQNFNFKVQSTGVIYFSDGTVNIIQGSEERDKYVDTVSTKSSLRRIISEAIELSKHPLNKEAG